MKRVIQAGMTAAALLLASGIVLAAGVAVEQPWSRATLGQTPNGAAYMTLVNHGANGDRLLSARTPVAERAELHAHRMADGMMRMERVLAIEIAAGATLQLAPGGLHVMLFGLREPLVAGTQFPLQLQFERAGAVEVGVPVVEATVGAPGMAPMHPGKHAK